MKKALISALIPLMAIAPAAAQTTALNADGFEETPKCSSPRLVNQLTSDKGQFPSGIKARSPRFDLEIYTVMENGKPAEHTWTLVGDNRQGKLCILDSASVDKYSKYSWYATYFKASQR